MFRTIFLGVLLAVCSLASWCTPNEINNLALTGVMRSWETPQVIPGHEPRRANDGSLRSFWEVHPENLPADLGVEWADPKTVSSVIVRYFDGRMVRGPWVARTQEWARLQYWDGSGWRPVNAQAVGQETAVVRYTFTPVTTTRVRLLFTEPPDPQVRYSGPEKPGVYICEFEVYSSPPFQQVTCPGCLQNVYRPDPTYNEEPAGDSDVDLAGPLIVEPKQTRVFSDVLQPTLSVSDSPWAQQPAEVHASNQRELMLKNGFVGVTLTAIPHLRETRVVNLVTGEEVKTDNSSGFTIKTAEGELNQESFQTQKIDTSGSASDVARIKVDMTSTDLDVSVQYELRREDHFYHKWLFIRNKRRADQQINDVTVSALGLPQLLDLMAGNELTYPTSRLPKGGFFECLETVYWDHAGDALTYYPGVFIKPGEVYETERAVVGVYKNSGETIAGWDRGVRDWVIEYHAQVSPIPAVWPDIYLEGWSAHVGLAEMLEKPAWTDQFLEVANKLGVRYMDTREDMFRVLHDPPEWRENWVALATKHNIGTGFWMDFGDLHDDNGYGKSIQPLACKRSPAAEEYFRAATNLVADMKLTGLHWGDFFTAWSCNDASHGHLPGKYSIYAQGQRMIRFANEMHSASPGLMLGADGGLTSPQYGRYADSRHHGGGVDAEPAAEPDIQLDRLYAEMNREYLHNAHMTYLRPWYRLLNCVNHFGDETHHFDQAGYRYALLSALGLAGQLTFNDAPENMPADEIAFTQLWEAWARSHKEYLKRGDRLFDRSVQWDDIDFGDTEGLAGVSHLKKDRGFVFLSNPTPVPQIAELKLALDGAPNSTFDVKDIFPRNLGSVGTLATGYRLGDSFRVAVPAKQVRILYVGPRGPVTPSKAGDVENKGASLTDRYLGNWSVERVADSMNARLRARFIFPLEGQPYLESKVTQSEWAAEPWAFNKAYLVLYIRTEKRELKDYWVSDDLLEGNAQLLAEGRRSSEPPQQAPISVVINGKSKLAVPFKTLRNQKIGSTRCFFVSLEGETKAGKLNDIEVTLPIQQGLVFSGAYLDLPDQMPADAPAAE